MLSKESKDILKRGLDPRGPGSVPRGVLSEQRGLAVPGGQGPSMSSTCHSSLCVSVIK